MKGDVVLVEIWSDVVCPWCAVGRARFMKALESFEHREQVEIRFRSFELDPNAPATRSGSMAEHLAAKYGMSVDEAQEMNDHLEQVAALDGVEIHFSRFRAGNTFDAHRLLHLAHDHGRQVELNTALLTGVFRDGLATGDPAALTEVAVSVGLDPAEVADVLGSDRYTEAVLDDERRAAQLNVTGVPFFLIDRKYAIPGAQSVERFELGLDMAWQKTNAPA